MIALVPAGTELAPPRESLGRLFLGFLKFGSLVGPSRRADRDDPARARGRGEMGFAGALQPRARALRDRRSMKGRIQCVHAGGWQLSSRRSA